MSTISTSSRRLLTIPSASTPAAGRALADPTAEDSTFIRGWSRPSRFSAGQSVLRLMVRKHQKPENAAHQTVLITLVRSRS